MEILETLFTVLGKILGFLFSGLEGLLGIKTKDHSYNASFANESALLKWYNKGFKIGSGHLTVKQSHTHQIVFASTGMGKSVNIAIPNAYSLDGSIIFLDVKGELFEKTSGFLSQTHDIKVLDFSNPENSDGYNIIDRCTTSTEINQVSSMLMQPSHEKSKGDNDFWTLLSTSLTSCVVGRIKEESPEFQNPTNVLAIINKLSYDLPAVKAWFAMTDNQDIYNEFKAFIYQDEKIIKNVISTVKANLQLFTDKAVQRVTSFDSIDMTQFRKKKTALYIRTKPTQIKYFGALSSIFYQQLFNTLMDKTPAENDLTVYCMIDEANSLRFDMAPQLALLRGYKVSVCLIYQNEDQVINTYGKAKANDIFANCTTKIYFTGQPLHTAQKLEAILGKYEYENKKGQRIERPLLTSTEISQLPPNKCIVLHSYCKPSLVKLTPYYKVPKYRRYSKLPPIVIENKMPFANVPILQLPEPLSEPLRKVV